MEAPKSAHKSSESRMALGKGGEKMPDTLRQ